MCEIFTTVQFNSTFLINFNRPSYLQSDGTHKLISRSLAALRRFCQRPKGNRPAKKPKVSLEPIVGLMAEGKTVTPAKHGAGKGLMKAPSATQEKPPVFLCEDSKYAMEHISSIISIEDYEDLGNQSTKAMGESGLFAVAQVIRPVTFMSINSICFQSNSLFCSCIF